MKRAILHIGTEKTGTTSIQKFLFQNRSRLCAAGVLFPASAGYISNQKLVVYGKHAPEEDLVEPPLDANDPAELALWKEQFVTEHCAEVLAFHANQMHDSTVIYSAEHLQSRLTRVDEIKRVARLLRPLFDEVSVLVYLRRQDKYALSAHSTSVRGGNPNLFTFEGLNAAGPYYDYRQLLENWSSVFGKDALTVRLFERNRLSGGDVVSDFCEVTGIDVTRRDMQIPEPENEALSHTALCLLRHFNGLAANDPRLHEMAKHQLRPFLLEKVQSITDELGRIMPARTSAMAFQQRFAKDNQWIADQWMNGQGFDASFDEYPDTDDEPPVIEHIDRQLDELIESISGWRSDVKTRFNIAISQRLDETG